MTPKQQAVVDRCKAIDEDQSARAEWERKRIASLIETNDPTAPEEARRWLVDAIAKPVGEPESEHFTEPAMRVVERYLGTRSTPKIVSTGFADLDEIVSLEPQSLVVIGARSGRGKSAFSTQLAMNVGAEGSGCSLFFSSEMSSEQLALRAMCMMASVDSKRMRRGTVNDEEMSNLLTASNMIRECMSWVTDKPGGDILELKDIARREKRRIEQERGRPLKLIVVDYLQRFKPGKAAAYQSNREQQVAAVALELKELARELNVCVVAPAQLNADGDKRDDGRPSASDIRESKGVENEADVVLLVHNPNHATRGRGPDADLSVQEPVEMILAKGRSDGNGLLPMWFTPLYARFDSMSDSDKRRLWEEERADRERSAKRK